MKIEEEDEHKQLYIRREEESVSCVVKRQHANFVGF